MTTQYRLISKSMALLFVGVAMAFGQTATVLAHDAWVRVPALPQSPAAVYMVLENRDSQPKVVVSASSQSAVTVEIHEMTLIKPEKPELRVKGMPETKMNKTADHLMMTMTPAHQVVLPPKSQIIFAANGRHLMLFGLKSRPAPGSTITVTLKLDDGSLVPVTATVRD